MHLGRSLLLSSAVVLTLGLTGCSGSDDGPGDDPAPSRPDGQAAEPAPRVVGEGELEVVLRAPKLDAHKETSVDTQVTWDDERLFTVTPDNVLHAYQRDDLALLWEVKAPRDAIRVGICRRPDFASEKTLVVFVGHGCSRLVAYDVATGKKTHDEVLVDRYVGDHPFEHQVVGVEKVDGRLWYAAWHELGYLDPDGKPVAVLENNDLGLIDEEDDLTGAYHKSFVTGLTTVASEDLFVVETLHTFDKRDSYREWVGYTVAKDSAEVDLIQRWKLDARDGKTLGLDDLRPDPPIVVPTEQPGAVVAAGLTGGRVALGQPDPTSGQLLTPALTPADEVPSVTESGLAQNPQFLVDDRVLYTSSDAPDDISTFRHLASYDLATGKERWRVTLPATDAYVDKGTDDTRDLSLGEDGSLYAVGTDRSDARLHRVAADTGELMASWTLPSSLVQPEYRIHVVGDLVVAAYDDLSSSRVSPVVVLRSVDAPAAEPDPSAAPAATGTLVEAPAATYRLPEAVKWQVLPATDTGATELRQALHSKGRDRWSVISVSGKKTKGVTLEALAGISLDTQKTYYDDVKRLPERTVAGQQGYVIEGTGRRDGRPHEVDDLLYEFGAVVGDRWMALTIEVPIDSPENSAWIEAILASIRWDAPAP